MSRSRAIVQTACIRSPACTCPYRPAPSGTAPLPQWRWMLAVPRRDMLSRHHSTTDITGSMRTSVGRCCCIYVAAADVPAPAACQPCVLTGTVILHHNQTPNIWLCLHTLKNGGVPMPGCGPKDLPCTESAAYMRSRFTTCIRQKCSD